MDAWTAILAKLFPEKKQYFIAYLHMKSGMTIELDNVEELSWSDHPKRISFKQNGKQKRRIMLAALQLDEIEAITFEDM